MPALLGLTYSGGYKGVKISLLSENIETIF
jgi:hypothetical protein